jgi:hypothetical protein
MMETSNPPPGLLLCSKQTIFMAGLLVDVYGLQELSSKPDHISCLWLHHSRQSHKGELGNFASRIISVWNGEWEQRGDPQKTGQKSETKSRPRADRGLIAVAFDQRNHGTRLVSEKANEAWRAGNEQHAVDMLGIIRGTVVDTGALIDVVEGYVCALLGRHEKVGTGSQDSKLRYDGRGRYEGKRIIDQHLVLGVSLGGHSAWQTLFADPRVTAGVCIIGCPDYICELYHFLRHS